MSLYNYFNEENKAHELWEKIGIMLENKNVIKRGTTAITTSEKELLLITEESELHLVSDETVIHIGVCVV